MKAILVECFCHQTFGVFHASGTTIIITSGNERPVINNNSITISIEAESDFPSSIINLTVTAEAAQF
jgi:hypothetical protein